MKYVAFKFLVNNVSYFTTIYKKFVFEREGSLHQCKILSAVKSITRDRRIMWAANPKMPTTFKVGCLLLVGSYTKDVAMEQERIANDLYCIAVCVVCLGHYKELNDFEDCPILHMLQAGWSYGRTENTLHYTNTAVQITVMITARWKEYSVEWILWKKTVP